MLPFSAFLRKGLFAIAFLALGFGLSAAGAVQSSAPKSDAPKPGEPTDPKARKTFAQAIEWEKSGNKGAAADSFRKANKQDGGHCEQCLLRAYSDAYAINAFKNAEEIAREWLPAAITDTDKAAVHFRLAAALQEQGVSSRKESYFSESRDEFKAALKLQAKIVGAHYRLGISLAHLHQDEEARAEFATFLEQDRQSPELHERAERYIKRIDLARAVMAPPFSLTTLDGQHISMDGLAGKVVLIDFWATWCGPCRQALPRIQQIAKRFAGQPLVVLSISLDSDEDKWKNFVAKNGMTWPQYRDAGVGSRISMQFNVNAIPATFTIDADGVLEGQHVGDADIEGKLKKLIARAVEMDNRRLAPAAAGNGSAGAQ